MMKCFRFFSMLFVICTGSLFAYIHPCPGGWALDLEYLYLCPSVDDTYFVIESVPNVAAPNGTRKNNDFDYASGFRVGGIYAFCDCNREFQAYYTRLRTTTETKTVSGRGLWASAGPGIFAPFFNNFTGSATSDLDILYQRVDGLFAQQLWCCCGLDLYLLGGFEFAYARLHEQNTYRIPAATAFGTASYSHQIKTWGVGPEFGFELDYCLYQFSSCCPGTLSLAASSTGSILASKTKNDSSAFISDFILNYNVKDEKTWRLIPAWHARIGLNYATCFSCFGAALEIGYEFNTYLRDLARHLFPGANTSTAGTAETLYYNFDIQGLYLSLAVTF